MIGSLAAVALVAGTIDAMAGGGGLLTVPALLFAGLPPQLAIGTNKGQSVFGSFAAMIRYSRAGMVDARYARVGFPLGMAGSFAGASVLLWIRPDALRPIILVLLLAVAVFLAVRPPVAQPRALVAERFRVLAAAGLALAIGAYDGFFGPGTGTLLIIAFLGLLGTPLARASADAKVVNFASNLAAVILFSSRGVIQWRIALPMAGAQLLGGWIGAHWTVKGGDRRVRWAVLAVCAALIVKLASDWLYK